MSIRKYQRCNSKYICPGSKGVISFSVDWSNENNLLVPPAYLIPKTTKHFVSSKYPAKAMLVYLHTGLLQHFGYCYLKRRESFKVSLRTYLLFRMCQSIRKLQRIIYKESLIGCDQFKGSFVAFQVIK